MRRNILGLTAVTILLVAVLSGLALWLLRDDKPASYDTVEKLHHAAVKAGYPCPSWQRDTDVVLAAQSGSCSDSDLFETYANQADLQSQLKMREKTDMKLISKDIDPGVTLVGPNWTVVGNRGPVKDLQAHLGGRIIDHLMQ